MAQALAQVEFCEKKVAEHVKMVKLCIHTYIEVCKYLSTHYDCILFMSLALPDLRFSQILREML